MTTLSAKCPSGCGETITIVVDPRARTGRRTDHVCAKVSESVPSGASVAPPNAPRSAAARAAEPSRPWSAATPTACGDGHRHASKMEARVCGRLTAEHGDALRQQVRFPLLAIGAKPSGRAHYVCVDFVVTKPEPWRAIDAKARRRVSRDWPLRAAAFKATYGREIEEVSA